MTDFATLKRPLRPNNFLVCDDSHCPAARADMAPPVLPYPPETVAAAWQKVIAGQPRTRCTRSDAENHQYSYVQRSALMRFPDTITIRLVPEEGGSQTKILVWSRSKVGYSDLGVNRKRVLAWLHALTDELSASQLTIPA